MAGSVGVQNGIAAEDVVFQDAGSTPPRASVCRVCKTCLPEIRCNAAELSPADTHSVCVVTVYANGRLIRSVTNPVITVRVDVDLIAGVRTERLRLAPAKP